MDVGNYVVGPYNGTFNATLSISFYNLQRTRTGRLPDEIIPLSKTDADGVSTYFSLPDDESSTSITIPEGTSRLALEVFASGNGQEEFWYSNVPDEYSNTFAPWNATFLGQGPFREVTVYIDKYPVGVLWPFEVIFTGGICPGFWRPIVGHRTFDLPAYTFDFTPYIDFLRQGKHNIRFKIRGQPHTLQNWYVSGHLRVWSSNTSSLAPSGSHPQTISRKANITSTGKVASDNSSFSVITQASRKDKNYSMDYQNNQTYHILNNGSVLKQNLSQFTAFKTPLFRGYYSFKLDMQEVDNQDGTIDLNATLSQVFHRITTDIFNGSRIEEHAEVFSVGSLRIGRKRNKSQGNTSVSLEYHSAAREYSRDVKAVGFKVAEDHEIDKLVGSSMDPDRRLGLQFQVPNF